MEGATGTVNISITATKFTGTSGTATVVTPAIEIAGAGGNQHQRGRERRLLR
jgi:hypothetical protein